MKNLKVNLISEPGNKTAETVRIHLLNLKEFSRMEIDHSTKEEYENNVVIATDRRKKVENMPEDRVLILDRNDENQVNIQTKVTEFLSRKIRQN